MLTYLLSTVATYVCGRVLVQTPLKEAKTLRRARGG